MALKRLKIDGYGQVELNNVAFRRDGRIEAQCAPDVEDFADKHIENGMILAIDNVSRTVKLADGKEELVGLVYSAEHFYEGTKAGLKHFKLNATDDFLPRLGYLAVGDKFTTNCLCYDEAEFEGGEESVWQKLANGDAEYVCGIATNIGAIQVKAEKPSGASLVLRVIEKTTMPDGQPAVKFQVVAV